MVTILAACADIPSSLTRSGEAWGATQIARQKQNTVIAFISPARSASIAELTSALLNKLPLGLMLREMTVEERLS